VLQTSLFHEFTGTSVECCPVCMPLLNAHLIISSKVCTYVAEEKSKRFHPLTHLEYHQAAV
jgi:hypothetical protein